jgi:uroporphyrinogen decarboxylase
MGIDFSISESGGIAIDPVRCRDAMKRLQRVSLAEYRSSCGFVGRVLQLLRQHVPSCGGTVLGFVGLPFTLGSYLIEGKTGVASGFAETRSLMKTDPQLVHDMFTCLAANIGDYAIYQIESGAQVIQVFDSWAGHVSDEDYEIFCRPYQKQVIETIKRHHPKTPVIIYMAPGPFSKHGNRLMKLADTGADVISVDHTIDMEEACKILPKHLGVQGNLDPQLLCDGPLDKIKEETLRILKAAAADRRPHIMNLGHGILPGTPETHAAFFVDTVHSSIRHR